MTIQSTAQEPIGNPSQTSGAGRAISSRSEALQLASALVPHFRARAGQADSNRKVPDDNIAALRETGLLRLAAPRIFGGSQLGLAALVDTAAVIASGCGSTGWVYSVLAGHNWILSFFPVETQREVFADSGALVASVVRLGGNPPRRVPGGFMLEGAAGKFCSGVDHANWIIAGAAVDDGLGLPASRYFLIPKSEFEVIDDWFTVGLRGTGSKSLKLTRTFVPEDRTCSLESIRQGTAAGGLFHDSPVYRAPFPQVLRFQLVGVPIGLARAALKVFSETYPKRLSGLREEEIGELGAIFARFSHAHADIEAATALLQSDAAEIDDSYDGTNASGLDRTRYMRDLGYAVGKCRLAVNSLFEASGGSAIYDSFELQRIWRDVNAAAAHNAFMRDKVDTAFGRALLGLPPGKLEV